MSFLSLGMAAQKHLENMAAKFGFDDQNPHHHKLSEYKNLRACIKQRKSQGYMETDSMINSDLTF
jgi:hypothetical protein